MKDDLVDRDLKDASTSGTLDRGQAPGEGLEPSPQQPLLPGRLGAGLGLCGHEKLDKV
jgi:hypothetical protein